MLLMVEKGIRGVVRHTIYRYAKANNKYRKDYDKNKEPLLLGCKKIYMVGQCHESFQ